jgi:antitoxin HicB
MRANPAAGWRMSDIEAVCREHGVFWAPPRGGGSHYKIGHPARPKSSPSLTIGGLSPYTFASSSHFLTGDAKVMTDLRYSVVVEPLSETDGGGFVAFVPDLPGWSDGETPEEALANVRDAIEEWMAAARDLGHEIPAPSKRREPV